MLNEIIFIVLLGILFFICPALAIVLMLLGLSVDIITHHDNNDNQDYY